MEGGRIQLWNVDSGNVVFDELYVDATSSGRKAGAVAYSPDGQTIAATTGSNSIWLLDAQTGELRSKLTGHRGPVTGLAFAEDSLVSASSDYRVIIWEIPMFETGVTLSFVRQTTRTNAATAVSREQFKPCIQLLFDRTRPTSSCTFASTLSSTELSKGPGKSCTASPRHLRMPPSFKTRALGR